MLSYQAVALATLAGLASAAVTPTAPGPGQSYNEGADCPLAYDLDKTGTWKNVTISLMTGSNFQMVHLTDVVTGLDGTKGDGTYTWKCPAVTPNSAIYFYQFTNDGVDPTWTTRFAIASASGATTPPANSTVVDGATIQFGTGALAGGSAAANSTASGAATPSTVPANATSSSSSSAPAATSGSSTTTSSSTSTTSSPSGSSSAPAASGSSTSGAARVAGWTVSAAAAAALGLFVIVA